MVLTEGWDMPEVSCCILARPTKKMGLYRQMVGRILRPAEGKHDAVVLDHSGTVYRHGFVEDRVEWILDPNSRAAAPAHVARLERGYSSRLLECSQCGSIRVAGERCGHCGFFPQRRPRPVEVGDGDLVLVDRNRRAINVRSDPLERLRWHAMLAYVARERQYKVGWVAHKYREKFSAWPTEHQVSPIPPSAEVLSWVRSRTIAFAKARQKDAAA